LIAVCDIVREKAESVGKHYKVPCYCDYNEMLERHPEIEVINVLTPSGHHARNVLDLARFKKHIVVEKPLALSVADAENMIQACQLAGVQLFVVKQNRTNPPVVHLKKALESGRFGKIALATIRVRWCRDQAYYDQDAWRGTLADDGGVFMNQASHHIDLLSWLLGDVASVFAYSAARLVNIETDDTAVGVLRFKHGALGIVEATTATRPVDLEGSVSVLGENGTVEIGGFAVNQLKIWNFLDSTKEETDEILSSSENPPNIYGYGHARYLHNVVRSLREGSPSAVNGSEGLKSLRLINSLYESARTGKQVAIQVDANKPKQAVYGQD
jgi:predicted dehydrogenase